MNHFAYLPEHFLEQVSKQYDIVLVDGNTQNNKNQNIIFVEAEGQSLSSLLVHHAIHDQSIAIILGHTPLDTILSDTQIGQNITIINTASGLGSFAARGKRDRGDITKAMSFGFQVYDPYCVENLEEIITRPGKKYIRINQHLLSADQYPEIVSEKKHPDIYSLKSLGFAGEHATLLSLGSSILDAFHTTTLLQEQGEFMDVFVTSRTDFEISEELMLSIRESEHLRIIADQIDNKLWEQSIKAKLRDIGLFEADIHFISPRLEQVTSFLEEYVYEQSQMDGPGIAGRIVG